MSVSLNRSIDLFNWLQMKFTLPGLLLLLTCALQAITAQAADYRELLTRELDNRAVARHVVSYLADVHADSEQGAFWSAYRDLEAWQKPRYDQLERCQETEKSSVGVWMKSRFSAIFARLFPESFLNMLAGATATYLAELKSLSSFSNTQARESWHYVVAQEAAQAEALSLADQGDFAAARQKLQSFIADNSKIEWPFTSCD